MDTQDQRSRWLLFGGTAAVVLGALLPWATVNAGFVTVTKAGTDGDGVITLLLALVVGGLMVAKWKVGLGRGALIASLVLGLLVLAIAVYDALDVARVAEETEYVEVRASVGIGLWLTLLGSLAMIAGAIWKLRSRPSAPVTAGPGVWDVGLETSGYQPPPAPPAGWAPPPPPPTAPPAPQPPPPQA